MKVYAQDVMIYATMYVQANDAEEAQRVVRKAITDYPVVILADKGDNIPVSAQPWPVLPPVSLSPVATLVGPMGDTEQAYDLEKQQ